MFELRGVLENWHGFMIDALGECGEAAACYLEERNTDLADITSVDSVKWVKQDLRYG